jgi:hypothetical protein
VAAARRRHNNAAKGEAQLVNVDSASPVGVRIYRRRISSHEATSVPSLCLPLPPSNQPRTIVGGGAKYYLVTAGLMLWATAKSATTLEES